MGSSTDYRLWFWNQASFGSGSWVEAKSFEGLVFSHVLSMVPTMSARVTTKDSTLRTVLAKSSSINRGKFRITNDLSTNGWCETYHNGVATSETSPASGSVEIMTGNFEAATDALSAPPDGNIAVYDIAGSGMLDLVFNYTYVPNNGNSTLLTSFAQDIINGSAIGSVGHVIDHRDSFIGNINNQGEELSSSSDGVTNGDENVTSAGASFNTKLVVGSYVHLYKAGVVDQTNRVTEVTSATAIKIAAPFPTGGAGLTGVTIRKAPLAYGNASSGGSNASVHIQEENLFSLLQDLAAIGNATHSYLITAVPGEGITGGEFIPKVYFLEASDSGYETTDPSVITTDSTLRVNGTAGEKTLSVTSGSYSLFAGQWIKIGSDFYVVKSFTATPATTGTTITLMQKVVTTTAGGTVLVDADPRRVLGKVAGFAELRKDDELERIVNRVKIVYRKRSMRGAVIVDEGVQSVDNYTGSSTDRDDSISKFGTRDHAEQRPWISDSTTATTARDTVFNMFKGGTSGSITTSPGIIRFEGTLFRTPLYETTSRFDAILGDVVAVRNTDGTTSGTGRFLGYIYRQTGPVGRETLSVVVGIPRLPFYEQFSKTDRLARQLGRYGFGEGGTLFLTNYNGDTASAAQTTSTYVQGRLARGTLSAPVRVKLDDYIFAMEANGHDGTSFDTVPQALIALRAAENFTTTAKGTFIGFETTNTGTAGLANRKERVRITDDGDVWIHALNDATSGANYDSGSFILRSSYWNGADDAIYAITLRNEPAAGTNPAYSFVVKDNAGGTMMNLNNSGLLALPNTGSGAGVIIGGDAQIFRGAADRMDLANGDSFRFATDGATGSLQFGASGDASLFRGAADRLDLASGDTFNIVSGNLQIAATTVIDSSRNILLPDSKELRWGDTSTAGEGIAWVWNSQDYHELGHMIVVYPKGTSDHTAINNAITRAAASGIKYVKMGPGSFDIRAKVNVNANVSLIGSGRNQTILVGHSSLTEPVLEINVPSYTGNTNAGHIYGFFTVDASATTGTLTDAITCSGIPKSSLMTFIRVIGGYKGLKVTGAGGRVTWRDFHIYNCRHDGLDYTWTTEGENVFDNFYIEHIGQGQDSTADVWCMRFHGSGTDGGGIIVQHCKMTGDDSIVNTNGSGITASGGGTNYIEKVATNLESTYSLVVGDLVEITGGTGSGQRRFITAFQNTGSRLVVHSDWTTTPDGTSVFKVGNASPMGGVLVKGDDTHTADTYGAAYIAFTDVTADGQTYQPSWKFINAINIRAQQIWGLLEAYSTVPSMTIEYVKDLQITRYFANIPSNSPALIQFSGASLRSNSKFSGTTTNASTTAMVDTTKNFSSGGNPVVVGDLVEITSGTGIGEKRYVASIATTTNPNDTLNIEGTWTAATGDGYNVGSASNDNNLIGIFGVDSTNVSPVFSVAGQANSNPVGLQNLMFGGTTLADLTNVADTNANLAIIAEASSRNVQSGTQFITYASGGKNQSVGITDGGSNLTKWMRGNASGDLEMLNDGFSSVTHKMLAAGGIDSTGAYTNTSDARVKTDILVLDSPLDKVLGLRGVSFLRTDIENPRREIGFIAQEVEPLIPEVVKDFDGLKALTYSGIIPYLVEAIKVLHKRIKLLEDSP